MRLTARISGLLIGVAAGCANAAQEACPEGYRYKCIGGLLGVICWCEKQTESTIDPLDLIWDLDGGTVSEAHGLEVILSAQIPTNSNCRIDFEFQVSELSGPLIETRKDTLTAALPSYQFKRTQNLQRYSRINASGQAYDCPIEEFLSFEIVAVSLDSVTDNVLDLHRIRPIFTPLDDGQSPSRTPLPIVPLNRLPPKLFSGP